MNTKTLICCLVLFMSLVAITELRAQDKNPEYVIESTDLKELKKFKWKDVDKYFKDFDKKTPISIRVTYSNPSTELEKKGILADFDITVSGEAKHAKDLTDKLAFIVDTLYGEF